MYDLIVIGGGPAGYEGAIKAAQCGLSVALVSDSSVGGVCLHSGCIPSKTILHSTKLTRDHSPFAIFDGLDKVDLPVLQERITNIIKKLGNGISHRLKSASVEIVEGQAEILPKRGELFVVKAESTILSSKKLLIATGSEERQSLGVEVEENKHQITIRELLEATSAPRSMAIVGAGAIGVEVATMFARCGTEVTLLESAAQIIPSFSNDAARLLVQSLKLDNIAIHTSISVTSIHNGTVTFTKSGEEQSVAVEKVLIATGRIPVIPEGIENLGCVCNGTGALVVNSSCETSVKGCFAAGDCIGEPMLAHSATEEALRAIQAICDGSDDYEEPLIPQVLYTSPEIASIGLTEIEANKQGLTVRVQKTPLGGNGRFLAETAGERGYGKTLISEETGEVLGMELVAPNASELISIAAVIIKSKLTAKDLASIIFPHPTISEIIKQTIVEG